MADEKRTRWIVEVEVEAPTEYDAKRNVENWRGIVGIIRAEQKNVEGSRYGDHHTRYGAQA